MLLPAALGEGFSYPLPLFYLYERRSQIVHGSAVNISGEREYSHLLWLAIEIVRHFTELLRANPELRNHNEFIQVIEGSGRLLQAEEWLRADGNPTATRLAKWALRRAQG